MLVLHCVPNWASLVIRLALEAANVPHTLRWLDPAAGALNTPEFRRLNPHGLIPVMETPDGPVFETGAILLWLSERHDGLAPPPGSAERAAFLSWFIFTANTVHPTVERLITPHRPAGESAAAAVMAIAQRDLRRQLGELERVAREQAPDWLSPRRPSILTCYLPVLMRFAATDTPDPRFAVHPSEFPRLLEICAAIESTPAALRIAEEEKLGERPFSVGDSSAVR
jgi:glutathione S-transferase